jgi:hypothetical protein
MAYLPYDVGPINQYQGAPAGLNDPSRYRSAGGATAPAQPAADMNPAGAGSDPFAYTNGSLLTPWTKKFEWGGGGTAGAYTPPEHKAFEYGAFNYQAPKVGRMDAPTPFSYGDFNAPTADNFQQDPGYQFRLREGSRALQNSAAAKGTLLTGATAKALQDYGQEAGSQEYGAAYNRALQGYQTNRGNAAENWDRNFGAKLNTFNANTTAALGEGNLGLQVATAGWDRNLNLSRMQWQDQADAANRAASAGASNSALSYNQALQQYKMEHDIFQENQSNQYNRLMGVSQLGMQGAAQQGAYGSSYANNAGSIYGQQGNAAAAGQVGAANAWANGAGNAGNTMLGSYYAQQQPLSSYW